MNKKQIPAFFLSFLVYWVGGGGGRVKHILCLVSVMGLVTYKIPLSKKSSR